MTRSLAVGLVVVACLASSACKGTGGGDKDVDKAAHPLGDHSCASCGMVVREQSAPRAQVVHRDGTREYFCSVSDMVTYLQAPSPHGRVVSTHVEALDPNSDPRAYDTGVRPWVHAETAGFVLGVDKPRVMGTPVLVYSTPDQARAAATRHKGDAVDWAELQKRLRP